jgi:serine/threonine protein kinase
MMKESMAKIGDLGCAMQLPPEENPQESEAQQDSHLEVPCDTNPLHAPSTQATDPAASHQRMDSNPFDLVEDLHDEELLFDSGDLDLLDTKDDAEDLSLLPQVTEDMEKEPIQNASQPRTSDPLNQDDLNDSRVGTPYYIAPEIWKSKAYSKAGDVWALGVILFEMCCLQYPFPATELEELEKKVLTEKPQKHPNWVNSEFAGLFTKMLRKDPAKRPTIEDIIFSDIFQQKALTNRIPLPLALNKAKLQIKLSTGAIRGSGVEASDGMNSVKQAKALSRESNLQKK